MTKDEALRLALEALEYTGLKWPQVEEAITAIKAALEAKDEPVAWGYRDRNGEITDCITPHEHDRAEGDYRIPLYSIPSQRTWVGLSDKLKVILVKNAPNWTAIQLIEETELLLKEKNT